MVRMLLLAAGFRRWLALPHRNVWTGGGVNRQMMPLHECSGIIIA